jgi:hypothetical protein
MDLDKHYQTVRVERPLADDLSFHVKLVRLVLYWKLSLGTKKLSPGKLSPILRQV